MLVAVENVTTGYLFIVKGKKKDRTLFKPKETILCTELQMNNPNMQKALKLGFARVICDE